MYMKYSIRTHTYTSGEPIFDVAFTMGYLSRQDVYVSVNDEKDSEGNFIYRDYTWINSDRIKLNAALTSGDVVKIQRIVSKQELYVDFNVNGNATRENLNTGFKQVIMAMHELYDGVLTDRALVTVLPNSINSALDFVSKNSDAILKVSRVSQTSLDKYADISLDVTSAEQRARQSAKNSANSATASANSATASANSATASANSATASANSATASANSAVKAEKNNFVWKGTFTANTAYVVGNVVRHNGTVYVSIKDSSRAAFDDSDWEILVESQDLPLTSRGQILYYGSAGLQALAPGKSGYFLHTRGASGDPYWDHSLLKVAKLPDNQNSGWNRACGVVMSDGTLRTWGNTQSGVTGAGDTNESFFVPTMPHHEKLNVKKWIQSGLSSLLLTDEGDVYGWGYNAYGQLGNGTRTEKNSPTKLQTAYITNKKFKDISMGTSDYSTFNSALLLGEDNNVYAIGYNAHGQLGRNNRNNQTTPRLVDDSGQTVTKIFTNGSKYCGSFFVTSLNRLYATGYNQSKELGLGNNTTTYQLFTRVAVSGVKEVSSYVNDAPALGEQAKGHTLLLTTSGEVMACGDNTYGQLGQPTTVANSGEFKKITSLGTDNKKVYAAGGAIGWSMVLKNNGTLYCWGNNEYGQAGIGSVLTESTNPVEISSITNKVIKVIPYSGVNAYCTAVLTDVGEVWVTGKNNTGQLGFSNISVNKVLFTKIPFPHFVKDICWTGVQTRAILQVLTDNGELFQTGNSNLGTIPGLTRYVSKLTPIRL